MKSRFNVLMISFTYGGGERVAVKLIDMLAKHRMLEASAIVIPRQMANYMLRDISQTRLTFTTPKMVVIPFAGNRIFVSCVMALRFILKHSKRRSKIVLLLDTPESVLPAVVLRFMRPHSRFVAFLHGSIHDALAAFRAKRKLSSKLYSMLQVVAYMAIALFRFRAFTFIPFTSYRYSTLLPFPFDLTPQIENGKREAILYIGRLYHQVKGWFDVVLAYREFVKRLHADQEKAKLIIAGDGPEASVAREISQRFPNMVSYVGYVSGERKFDLLSKSRVCVIPSRYETFPITALEAIASGCLIVAYDIRWVKKLPPTIRKYILTAQPWKVCELADRIADGFMNYDKLKPSYGDIRQLTIYMDSSKCQEVLVRSLAQLE